MPRERTARLLFFVSLAFGLWLRVRLVFQDDGIYWPDEIYQSFEPAHRLVFGHGLVAWEFIEGARTWALPGLVALVLYPLKWIGLGQPGVYVPAVKLVFAALGALTGWGVWRLARAVSASELSASVAAACWFLAAPALYFAPRAMSENAAAVCTTFGLALVLEKGTPRRLLALGASLLGLAVLFRLQQAVFCVGVVAWLGWRARQDVAGPTDAAAKAEARRRTLLVLGVLAAWALVFGLFDAAVWHDAPGAKAFGLFHSAVVYLRFNLLEGKAAGWGTAAWDYYFRYGFSSMPTLAVVLLVAVPLSARRATGLVVLSALFLALHMATPHKELRFLVPLLPLLFALVGPALEALPDGSRLQLAAPAVCVAALASAWTHRNLTFGDLGAYLERAGSSAYDDFGPVNRLLLAASQREDLCGLRIDAAHLAWTGGSTYLHRKAPLYMPGTPVQGGHFNYVLTGPHSGGETVAKEGALELVRIPNAPCVPDPGYTWRLP